MIREPTLSTTNPNATSNPTSTAKTITTLPEYKLIEKIHITKSVLKSLIKFAQNSENRAVEGFLFGHESESEIKVENAFPSMLNSSNIESETHNIVLKNNL